MKNPSRCGSSTPALCQVPLQDQNFFTQSSCDFSADAKNERSRNSSKTPESKMRRAPLRTSCKRDRIAPLSGNPYFTSIVVKTQVTDPFSLVIPRCFRRFLPNSSVDVVLYCRGKRWKAKYSGQLTLKRINTGWRDFALDNKLKVGDGCVYELMDCNKLEFRVQILQGEVPTMSTQDLVG
ncbi:uncharacterized protein A4U43_C08F31160 [Asparagus officinalis]|uniref:B3 domain-containing protein Os04g0386900-like n=1 Tax=Asparagus officinalis TaxID=4686 RepID=UPI00098E2684|nr:B3 domain-containing protein Os04g0386900-like [Asparagus officinalis]ONK61553.1 uncharacterized protein A4U43_C08F31160 [Asparagus officinalis]